VADGRSAPIIWIGRREVDCRRHAEPSAMHPICIRRGAFGPGRPTRDLFLSPDHAVFFEDVLIPVRHLIDGVGVSRDQRDHVTYFHLELPTHDLLLAEGLAVQSFLDAGQRDLYASVGVDPMLAGLSRDAFGCYPLHVTGTRVARARAILRERATVKRPRGARLPRPVPRRVVTPLAR
jgi:hypothetical protein